VTDVVADAIRVDIAPLHWASTGVFGHAEFLKYRARILLSPTEIVNLGNTRRFPELEYETRDVLSVDIVTHLFALIPVDLILLTVHVALDEVAQKTPEWFGPVRYPPRRQQVGMLKYRPYSCTITSAATLDAPKIECLL
jgi:hypothetical protein